MNCTQFETLMMKHFEKTIKPKDACELAKHVLVCEPCRELYLVFDEATECAGELSQAPENFTQSVMAKVRAEKQHFVTEKIASATLENRLAPRLIAAFNIILFGIAFMFAFNPDLIHALPQPFGENLLNALGSVGTALNAAAEWVAQNINPSESVGITALLFAAVSFTLLFVLHSGEKAKV